MCRAARRSVGTPSRFLQGVPIGVGVSITFVLQNMSNIRDDILHFLYPFLIFDTTGYWCGWQVVVVAVRRHLTQVIYKHHKESQIRFALALFHRSLLFQINIDQHAVTGGRIHSSYLSELMHVDHHYEAVGNNWTSLTTSASLMCQLSSVLGYGAV